MQDARIRPRGVVFDYGKVLCLPQEPSDIESMAAICGMQVSRFQQLYWKSRLDYDCGEFTGEAYWDALCREDGKVLTGDQIADLLLRDSQSWSRRNEATISWVEQLKKAGLRLGILSNMPREISHYLAANCEWFRLFHSLTFSCDVGVAKPDAEIYEVCLKGMKLLPEEVLFLDDIEANVKGAAEVGIHGVIFDSLELTLGCLRQRFDLPYPVSSSG